MKKLLLYGLIVAGILILAHHWYVHGSPVDLSNMQSHEFLLALIIGLLAGGLLLA